MIYNNTPIIQLENELCEKAGVTLFVKREDLNHPCISGNKWWKLRYNLEKAIKKGHNTLLTFGGAYSNHIYAMAAAAHETNLRSIGIIRGEETFPLNATLTFAKSRGMKLHYVSREVYRNKSEGSFIKSLAETYGEFYLIPEGGTNALAIKGCEEWAQQLREEINFDYLCLAVGTGGTMAGMINVLKDKQIVGFSSLKGGSFLEEEIRPWLKHGMRNWKVETEYHFGGYGKMKNELMEFIAEFEELNRIPLDPVYTGKMMFGIFDLLKNQGFEPGSKILILHTGGLQGRPINF